MATLNQAAKSLGLQFDALSGKYYSPSTGKFYESKTGQAATTSQYTNPLGIFFPNPNRQEQKGVLSGDGFSFTPFTGTAKGISQGQYSVVDRIINQNPISASAYLPEDILKNLFGGFNFSGLPMTNSMQTYSPSLGMDGIFGAGRFLSAPAIQGLIK